MGTQSSALVGGRLDLAVINSQGLQAEGRTAWKGQQGHSGDKISESVLVWRFRKGLWAARCGGKNSFRPLEESKLMADEIGDPSGCFVSQLCGIFLIIPGLESKISDCVGGFECNLTHRGECKVKQSRGVNVFYSFGNN